MRPEPSKPKPAKTLLVAKEENHGHLIIKRSLCFQVPHEILKHISTRQSQTMPPRLYIVLVSGCCCSENTDEVKHRFSAEGSGQGFSQTAWSCSTSCLLLVPAREPQARSLSQLLRRQRPFSHRLLRLFLRWEGLPVEPESCKTEHRGRCPPSLTNAYRHIKKHTCLRT